MSTPDVVLLEGDCLQSLKELPDNCVDSIVTDPPYGLSFMGKKWDYDVPSVEIWREAMRVLKPGGHLLAFGGTRTYHRLAVNIEDAGFEIRDQIMWLYGSGFPKSMDVSKAIDKQAGAERASLGANPNARKSQEVYALDGKASNFQATYNDITAPATDAAKQWQGWGTALKPANEPIVVARKPLEKGLTVAQNVQKYGTGALNIDASRVAGQAPSVPQPKGGSGDIYGFKNGEGRSGEMYETHTNGRWPANVILDEEAGQALDAQTGELGVSKGASRGGQRKQAFGMGAQDISLGFGDSGGASRFFYCAKASKRERGEGNIHPTVKPVALMEYLIKLVTPADGVVLDCFLGSGTTGVAAVNLGYAFIGCELSPEYLAIAEARINNSNKKGA